VVALDWWYPSDDGRLLAYGYSEHGDEKSTLYVCEVDTGALRPDRIPRTRYSSLAWEPDSGGFYYTRYPMPGAVPPGEEEYHRHLFHHRLGSDPAADPDLFGEGRDMTEMLEIHLSPDGRWLVAFPFLGWVRSEVHVCDLQAAEPVFQPLVTGLDAIFYGEVLDDTLYLFTTWEAPRGRILAVDLRQPARAQWREVVATRPDVILESVTIAGGRLVAHTHQDVLALVEVYTTDGAPLPAPQLPPLGAVTELHGSWNSDDLFLGFESYTVPPTVYRYHLPDGTLSTWATVETAVDLSQLEVRQVWYDSKDGTPIPLFLIGRQGLARTGETPTVLHGYGGFNVSKSPLLMRTILPWVLEGGLFAVAVLRGGGEYGEEWHQAGMLEKKQNVFDDFIAAGEYLIREGYTRSERLGIWGRSNGGLLVGAALVQRPDLFQAVVCQVPLLDMLRYHLFRIARLWIPEYGSAEDPAQAEFLWAYSPYHHVTPGVEYPAVLFTTAESDSRVDPLHARKMAALLQATPTSRPVLLRVETEAGHGVGIPLAKLIVEQTDIWTFLAWQLGLTGAA
jgi:prolyl oligopeptidase